MKNTAVIVAVFVFVGILGFGLYTLYDNSSAADSRMESDQAMMQKSNTPAEPNNMMGENNSGADANSILDTRYIQYSESAFENSSGNRRVLFFYASWCPTCRPADASFTQNISKIPNDLTVIRVNYNDPNTDQDEKDLAKKYGITYQHTFVQIDNTGKEINKWNGGGLDELLSNVR